MLRWPVALLSIDNRGVDLTMLESGRLCQAFFQHRSPAVGMRIAAIAMAVPARIQTAQELAALVDRSPEWIEERTGVLRRHVAPDNMSPAQLAAQAARQVLEQSGQPDLLLYAGALTQQLVPDTAAHVLRELSLDGTPGFTVNQTCLSFLTALQVAHGLLTARSYRRILVCAAELASRGRNFREPESAALLGDGAAAAMLEFDETSPCELIHSALQTWTAGLDFCGVPAGIHPPPRPGVMDEALYSFHMQGPQLYRFVSPRLKRFLREFFDRAGHSPEDVRVVIPHQASAPGLRLLERCGFAREQVMSIVADYGNCVAASIPMALTVAVEQQRISRGDLVLLVGTSAGVSLGAALLRW